MFRQCYCFIYNFFLLYFLTLVPFNSEALSNSTLRRENLNTDDYFGVQAAQHVYDVIVVGGGAAGCPLARTLAESGKEVLLIERGGPRRDHPKTLDIYGAGIGIDDPEISQLVVTKEGIRSHIASVLSGGTAINMAIVIGETDDFFNFLESFPGVSFDRDLLTQAMNWSVPYLSNPMPESIPYGRRWRIGLSDIMDPNVGYRYRLELNSTWRGSTLFDSDNNWFRRASDLTLGVPGVDFPPTLHVLLRHTVHKIEFESESNGSERATCVIFQASSPADIAPIVSPQHIRPFGIKLPTFTNPTRFTGRIPSATKFRACVKPGGEIISSAGAILTPMLLYKSGVGPAEYVKNLGVPLVKEVRKLGSGLKDRPLIPVGLFFKDKLPPSGFPPRICQSIGLAQLGPSCDDFPIGGRSLGCTAVTAEEASGARIAEGIILATRFVVPPELRNMAIVELLFQVLKDCSEGQAPYGNPLLSLLCPIALTLSDCLKKVAANFYFVAEPKSEATMNVNKDGILEISGNYLTDPQDVQDAVRGLANILRVIDSGAYGDIFEAPSLQSCPVKILNGLVTLSTNLVMRLQELSSLDGVGLVEEFVRIEMSKYNDAVLESMSANKTLEASGFADEEAEKEAEGAWFQIFGERSDVPGGKLARKFWTSQKYATYPPALPEPTDAKGLERFAKTWLTSVWHWVGSAKMGQVVDSRFKVHGFSNLRIIDASVLNQVTRMNPFFTLVSLGRYAGQLIVREA